MGHKGDVNDKQADEIEQGAIFEIEGPDENACVWLVAGKGEDAVVVNLGLREAVATKLADWLAEIDFGDRSGADYVADCCVVAGEETSTAIGTGETSTCTGSTVGTTGTAVSPRRLV
jgi:hypothetical protein